LLLAGRLTLALSLLSAERRYIYFISTLATRSTALEPKSANAPFSPLTSSPHYRITIPRAHRITIYLLVLRSILASYHLFNPRLAILDFIESLICDSFFIISPTPSRLLLLLLTASIVIYAAITTAADR
jgi:hypothetical protein